jgi:hypothetical protein
MTTHTHTHSSLPPNYDRLLAAKDAAEELGISVSLFWKLNSTGDMPAPIYVTAKTPRWRRSELYATMETRRATCGPKSKRGACQ